MTDAEQILIIGYFGFDNAGDELILHSILAGLSEARPEIRAVVTSGDPATTRELHGVDAVFWSDIGALIEAAKRSRLILVGGGGLFQDHWEFDPTSLLSREYTGIAFFSTAALLAILLDRPLVILGVGVGPLHSDIARDYTRMVFDQAVSASVRDAESRDLVLSLGIEPERVRLTADPAFAIDVPEDPDVTEAIRRRGIDPDRELVLAVCLREWDVEVDPERWETDVARALDGFVERHGAKVLFVPFQVIDEHLSDDLAVAHRVRDRMENRRATAVFDDLDKPSRRVAAVASCSAVLAMRLHSMLFAAKAGVPVVALSYDQKIDNAMRRLGAQERCFALASFTVSRLGDALDATVSRSRELRAETNEALAVISHAAHHNNRILEESMRASVPQSKPASPEALKILKATTLARALDAEAQKRIAASLRDESTARDAELERVKAEGNLLRAERKRLKAEMRTLVLERQRLREAIAEGEATLYQLTQTKSLAIAEAHWRLRRRLKRLFPALHHRLAHVRRGRVASAVRRLFRWAKPMTYYSFAFDSFKRNRQAHFEHTLEGVSCPSLPGLVSIVLPVYNGASMVRESVDSVLAQTYRSFELICIDDGSTDETGEILDEYAARDERVRVVHQENRKIPRTLSRGFAMARGQYLTWTSADNRLKPEFLERMVDCLERHPGWDMAFANIDLIGERGEPLRGSDWYRGYQVPDGSEHVHLPTDVSELNVWPNNYVGAAFLYRDRVAWSLGDYSRIRFTTEDYDYWMRVNEFLNLRHTDFSETVYEYRFHGSSLTARDVELGITRHRVKLMVFDDFRRDFALTPVLWDMDPTAGESCRLLADRLSERIEGAGHPHLTLQEPDDVRRLPLLWLPAVHLRIVEEAEELGAPGDDLPQSALRVGVVTGPGPLPSDVDPGWDLCVFTGPASATLPRLGEGYRGWLSVTSAGELFTFLDIRAKSRQLERIESEIVRRPSSGIRASVILCTVHRGKRLAQAIASVARQSLPDDDYEVLVVNNKPGDPLLRDQIEALREEHFAGRDTVLRHVLCPLPGLSHARNAGISEARGRILCFLDDDAIAQENWLEEVCQVFDDHLDAGVVGGHIVLQPPDPPPAVLNPGWERYWSQFLTTHKTAVKVRHWWDFPWGANWSARRSALLEIGGFRNSYGRRGSDFSGGEEIVAASLVQRIGYSIMVAPEAKVLHDVEPDRYSYGHVRRTIIAGTLINYQAQRDLYLPMESSVWKTVRWFFNPALDRSVSAKSGLARLRHWIYRREAWIRLLKVQLRDLARRMRRPLGKTR